MVNIQPYEIITRLFVAVLAAMATCWTWMFWSLLTRQPIMPERSPGKRRDVPWRMGTILLVFVINGSVTVLVAKSYQLIADQLNQKSATVPSSHLIFVNGLAMAISLLLVPGAVRMTSGGRPRDYGLNFDQWWPQVVCGVIATLIAAPPVYAVQFDAAMIWTPVQHPVTKMITDEFSAGVGSLAVVTAVVLAPMFEELVFRGLLQSWLVGLFRRSRLMGASASVDSPYPGATPTGLLAEVEKSEPNELPHSSSTELQDSRAIGSPDRGWIGIVLTSLLFAGVHAPQWPAPIPLFFLALVIGTVYDHTGSLITAILMHATFNGLTVLMLFMAVFSGEKLEPAQLTVRAPVGLRTSVELGKHLPPVAIGHDLTL